MENGLNSTSLLFHAYYDHHMPLALYLIGMGRDEHPLHTFFLYAFEDNWYDHKSHEYDEKISILDAINKTYNFEETFKADYQMLKHNGSLQINSGYSHWRKGHLIIENLIIFEKYVQTKKMSTKQLLGDEEYSRLIALIPHLKKTTLSA